MREIKSVNKTEHTNEWTGVVFALTVSNNFVFEISVFYDVAVEFVSEVNLQPYSRVTSYSQVW